MTRCLAAAAIAIAYLNRGKCRLWECFKGKREGKVSGAEALVSESVKLHHYLMGIPPLVHSLCHHCFAGRGVCRHQDGLVALLCRGEKEVGAVMWRMGSSGDKKGQET